MRQDIQALRGLAVLMVVLYHVGLGPLPAGYLGVDIFFVISGFLITSLIATGLDNGRFSLIGFYFRRAKRLLPAAYVVIALTATASRWILDAQELRDLSAQVLGALSFTANVVLWQQAGYFDSAADLKPLLHTWSLSLEEQYYLLVPAAMMFTPRRLWLPLAAGGLLVSLGLCLAATVVKPVAAFYLLPTRAWELLAGSVGALAVRAQSPGWPLSARPLVRALQVPSLSALVLLPFFPIGHSHPGAAAMLVCAATLAVILRHDAWLEQALVTRVLARVGDFSYSLYLVHWPLMALLRNAWGNPSAEIPVAMRVGVLCVSLLVAYVLYRLVERPVHAARWSYSPRLLGGGVALSLLLMGLTPGLNLAAGHDTVSEQARLPNHGLAKECDFNGPFTSRPACRTRPGARWLVWGDSFAMHLVPGLAADPASRGIVQATMNTCGPFTDIAPVRTSTTIDPSLYDSAWARRCIAFNDSVLEFARSDQDIEIVVLSSLLTAYTDPTSWQMLERGQGSATTVAISPERNVEALLNTAAALRAAGKKVVLVAPPPLADFDVGVCLERQRAGRLALGTDGSCLVDRESYRKRRHAVLAMLDAVQAAGLPVISFDALLCGPKVCKTTLGGIGLYRDYGHFSIEGSKRVARALGLVNRVTREAI